MLRSRSARIGALVTLGGLATLGGSLFHWNQTNFSRGILYPVETLRWVLTTSSSEPAVARDEVWNFSADCLREAYADQSAALKRQLAAHIASKPPPVVPLEAPRRDRASSFLDLDTLRTTDAFDRSMKLRMRIDEVLAAVAEKYGRSSFEEREELSRSLEKNNLAADPAFLATRIRLKQLIERSDSERENVQDKRLIFSEIRNALQSSAVLPPLANIDLAAAKTGEDKIDVATKHLLGLQAFPLADARAAIKKCRDASPVKQIVESRTYKTDLGRWPVETPISFWTGLAVLLTGILLGPAASWVAAGKS